MGLRDPGRARLRPSRLGEWLAGRLALAELCKAIENRPSFDDLIDFNV